jgi:predicted outer membrane repeat protein
MIKSLPILLFLLICSHSKAAVIYVDINATGANNGSSWTDAYTDLQTALSVAFINDDIWVANGIYKPTATTSRSISFVMKNGVDMYGGFAGTETAVNQRNISANPTTLSGDIGAPGDNTDNTFKVVKVQNFTSVFTFDGFRVSDGYDASSSGKGAGIYVASNSGQLLTFRNCLLYNNYAYHSGGGMIIDESNTAFYNCEFLYNSTYDYGGGAIYSDNVSHSTIKLYDCKFIGNSARDGAVINFDGIELILERNLVTNNSASTGSLINIDNDVTNFEINNSLIIGNEIDAELGSFIDSYTTDANSSSLTNVTFCHNKNSSNLGPYQEAIYQTNSAMVITNCIIYGNTPSDLNVQIDPGNTVINSIVENGYAGGTNIITTDPGFVNPSTLSAGPFDASMFDYSLLITSPAVNTGNNTYALPFSVDYLNNTRIQQNYVDRGAIESPFADVIAPVASCSAVTVYLDANGAAVIDSSDVGGGSYDNLGIATMTVSETTFDCSNLGTNPVTLIVTDAAGNADSCIAVVTVADNLPPVVSVQNVSVYLDPAGNADISVNDVTSVITDNCGLDTTFLSQTAFTCADAGPNTISFTAVDQSGNSTQVSFTVTVIDTVNPTAIAQDISVYVNGNGNAGFTAAMINNGSYDDCNLAGMTVSPNVFNCSNIGAPNTVTLTVEDDYGNTASATAMVTVLDTLPPVTIGQDITVDLGGMDPYVITPADLDNGSEDNCTSITQTIDMNSFAFPGIYDVVLTSTDAYGNTSTDTVQVTVIHTWFGIEENGSLITSVHPNPTSGEVFVGLSAPANRVSARVLDVTGKIIQENTFLQTDELTISFDGAPGFYVLEVRTSENEWSKTKILKR